MKNKYFVVKTVKENADVVIDLIFFGKFIFLFSCPHDRVIRLAAGNP